MSAASHTVEVPLPGRAYSIEIGSGLIAKLGSRLRAQGTAKKAVIVTDANVGPRYSDVVESSLRSAGFDSQVVTVPAGDGSKSLEQAGIIYDRLADRRHGRGDPIVALGGGMVGDLAGFVAATWMRGVPFVQCPTTLEADIDASVGGKTAVNHARGKNLIGAFHQPVLVCIDVDCLGSLSDRDYRAGLAESVKHAIIHDETFLAWHEQNIDAILCRDPKVVAELIRRNCEIKAAVVVEDEREASTVGVGRAALNFGHTIGHAIEAECGYELRHGEAVALGMTAALDLAASCRGFPDADRRRTVALLGALGLPDRCPRKIAIDNILDRMSADKKALDQTLRFVLPDRIGAMEWWTPPDDTEVTRAIRGIAGE